MLKLTYPSITLDASPQGFVKGLWKYLGVLVATFVVAGLTNIIPVLQETMSSSQDEKVILITGLIIGGIKWLLTWLTTPSQSIG